MKQDRTYIRLPEPRRSWLVHCNDPRGNLAACVIAVEHGSIMIYAPDNTDSFGLEAMSIAEFRAAFDEAIEVAEADLRARAANLNLGGLAPVYGT